MQEPPPVQHVQDSQDTPECLDGLEDTKIQTHRPEGPLGGLVDNCRHADFASTECRETFKICIGWNELGSPATYRMSDILADRVASALGRAKKRPKFRSVTKVDTT